MAEHLSEDELDLLVKILQIVEPVYGDENIDIYKYTASVRSTFFSLVGKLAEQYGFDENLI